MKRLKPIVSAWEFDLSTDPKVEKKLSISGNEEAAKAFDEVLVAAERYRKLRDKDWYEIGILKKTPSGFIIHPLGGKLDEMVDKIP